VHPIWFLGRDRRDGNPNVTAETSLNAAERLRRSILDYYIRRLDEFLSVISFPCSRPSLERKVNAEIQRDMRRFPATRIFEKP